MSATTYQLVPYLIGVHLRGKPDETRPVDDLDGKGSTLQDACLSIFDALRDRELIDPGNSDRKLRLVSLRNGHNCIVVELEPGRSGVVSRLETRDTPDGPVTRYERTRRDTEYVPVRNVIYFPPGSHYAILMAERVGTSGALTFLGRLLTRIFQAYFPEHIIRINPAVTGEVMRKLAAEKPVNSLVFTRPRPSDKSGAGMLVAGEMIELEVRFKPPRRRRWGWDALPKKDGEVTRDSLVGMLGPALGLGGTDDDVQKLLDEGWQAATEVTLRKGVKRTVNVGSSSAVSMSFPIEETSPTEDRPTDDDFRNACRASLEVFADQYGVRPDAVDSYTWEDGEHPDVPEQDRWKVIWDEPS